MNNVYESFIFSSEPDWDCVPTAEIASFHWENPKNPYRPKSFAQLCAVKKKGFFVRMWSFESPVRCENSRRNEPMYEDSCLEFFINPNPKENSKYTNFEMNPKGAYLAQIGEMRENRVFFTEKPEDEAKVTPFTVSENGEDGWGVNLFIPFSLFRSLGIPNIGDGEVIECCGNFYKCGDKTVHPHFGAFFPVDSAELGFHNPARFGKIILTKKRKIKREVTKERLCFRVNSNPFDINEIQTHFSLTGKYLGYETIHNGHINNTFCIRHEKEDGRIVTHLLQGINNNVFKDVDSLMENILGITTYLADMVKERGGDPQRETLLVHKTINGHTYHRDGDGNYWRIYNYISDAYTLQSIENPQVFYNAAKAFGDFQRQLADYPIEKLHETIPNFHNTVSRYNDLMTAIKEDKAGRVKDVQKEIEFAMAREKDCHVLLDLLNAGELPLRVTHNDTKLNNIMFDNKTNEGICVIDLDTVMPGLSLYDFGDSIRFGASTATEDEKDLDKVSMSLELFEAYTAGYLSSAKESLTENEVKYLPFSAKIMTYECGIRFLTDYLNGDTYFKIAYPEHNLDRCHTQFKLVYDMEQKMDEMQKIVEKIYNAE